VVAGLISPGVGVQAVHSLPIFVRLQGKPVILLGEGEAAAAKRRLLDRAGAIVVSEDAEAQLAIVALEEPEAASARLRGRGILVNVVDRPDLCDFTLPAIVDRDPVLIAIGTGGASAGLAKALRQRLEAVLPASLAALAKGLQQARSAIRSRWPENPERRRAIDAALEAGGALDCLSGRSDVAAWLQQPEVPNTDELVVLTLQSTDPDSLSLREARLLGQAERIFHRPDVPAAILDRARADAMRISCASAPEMPGSGLSLDISLERA
jgi:uroporphyrin-III C-methyltransferase/precorrin-2 dehydrogenase/sirohydrochlorin ferrochelatase